MGKPRPRGPPARENLQTGPRPLSVAWSSSPPGLCCAGVNSEQGTNRGGRPGTPSASFWTLSQSKVLENNDRNRVQGGKGYQCLAWVKGPGNLKPVAVGPRPRRSRAAAGRPPKVTRRPLEGHAQPRACPPQVSGRGRGPTYCAGQPPGALLEQTHDPRLLRGRAAAADHGRALAG